MYKWKVKELENEQKAKKPNKLLFICNTQWEKHPDKRNSFFHKKIIEDAEYHKWGLLSTLELYKALLKIYNNELSKEEVINVWSEVISPNYQIKRVNRHLKTVRRTISDGELEDLMEKLRDARREVNRIKRERK